MTPDPKRTTPVTAAEGARALKIFTREEMAAIDRAAIAGRGIPGAALMDEAGRAVWSAIAECFPDARRLVVVCGKGNNGGDGFVVARLAAEAGREVAVALLAEPAALAGDTRTHFDGLPETIRPAGACDRDALVGLLAGADLVVDALLGTGTRGRVEGTLASAIDAMNARGAAGVPIVAVDIPSGVPADAGWDGAGAAIRATLTVTLGGPKVGVVVEPGLRCAGRVRVAPINFPPDLLVDERIPGHLLTERYVAGLLPGRRPDGHKGTFGRCLLVVGSVGLAGAAILAARGALRSGAGLVHLVVPDGIYSGVIPAVPEATVLPMGLGASAYLDGMAVEDIVAQFADRVDALAVGPGLGRRPQTRQFVDALLARFKQPLLLDADAIAVLRDREGFAPGRTAPTAITPHPGELAALLGLTPADIQLDRIGHAVRTARRFGCHVLLKGAQTVIAHPSGRYFINPTGNTGLAKGGSGDVLAGLIAGLSAQGVPLSAALRLGAFLHGLSADLLAGSGGKNARSILATDVVEGLHAAFAHIEAVARAAGA